MWTGFYGGLNLGGGWVNGGNDGYFPFADPAFPVMSAGPGGLPNLFMLPGAQASGSNAGIVGGGQVGFNYQFAHNFVVGAEADFQGASLSSSNGGNSAAYPSPYAPGNVLAPLAASGGNFGLPWFGTVRGRLGYLFTPTLLIYGTGGFAYGGAEANGLSTTVTGWTAGGGVEWMFMPNWSAKVEYLHAEFGGGGFNGNGGFGWSGWQTNPQLNVVRAGVNYHFNWGAASPIMAKF
jgi:outer membrane immunogenic protein